MRQALVILLFFYIPTAFSYMAPSYSQSCYSPVEMALLFGNSGTKKKKSGPTKASLRKGISGLEKRISDLEEELDEISGELGDSLKGRRKEAYRTAGKIQEYMENEYSGWECGKGTSKSRRSPHRYRDSDIGGRAFLLLQDNFFWQFFLIQPSFGEKLYPGVKENTCVKTGGSCVDVGFNKCTWVPASPGARLGTCKKEKIPEQVVSPLPELSPKKKCENQGKELSKDGKTCISKADKCKEQGKELSQDGKTCISKADKCKEQGKELSKDGKTCISKADKCKEQGKELSKDGKTCISKADKCKEQGKELSKNGKTCISKSKKCEEEGKKLSKDGKTCISKADKCKEQGKELSQDGKTCISKADKCKEQGKELSQDGKTCISKADKCKEQGKELSKDGKTCISKADKCKEQGKELSKDGKTCISKADKCKEQGKELSKNGKTCISKSKKCEEEGKKLSKDGKTCISKADKCKEQGKELSKNGKTCISKSKKCEEEGKKLSKDGKTCISKADKCKEQGKELSKDGKTCISKSKKCEEEGKKLSKDGKTCISKADKCKEQGKELSKNGKTCISKSKKCEEEGKKLSKDGKTCISKADKCKEQGKELSKNGKTCISKSKKCEEEGKKLSKDGKTCISKADKCKEQGKILNKAGAKCITQAQNRCQTNGNNWRSNKCFCSEGKEINDSCECSGDMEPWSAKEGDKAVCKKECTGSLKRSKVASDKGKCVKCPKGGNKDWQNDSAFGRKGKVNKSFCNGYGKDKRVCKNALSRMKRLIKELEDLQNQLEKKRKLLHAKELSMDESEEKPQAFQPCVSCVRKFRSMNRSLSGSQIFGNVLSMGLGAVGSIWGVDEARRSQSLSNEMLALQGFPAENNFGYSLAGIGVGFPFLARGIHGLAQGNASRNAYACSPTASAYPSYASHHSPFMMY